MSLHLHLHLVGPNCKVQVFGLSPTNVFRAIPIPPLPLLNTALTESMSRNSRQSPKTGFLTMDMSQKLILLLENDPRIKTCPVIGIWVSGVTTFVDPFVWASCLRFFSCPEYQNRAVRPEEPFLLVVYSSLHSSPEFYDCISKTNKVGYSLLAGSGQLIVTKVPSFSSKVCSISICPTDNSRRLRLFHDAEVLFEKDLDPLPYCDSAALAFPSGMDGYPLPAPTPPTKNFILKPCVPDLSLLSEVSQCSVQGTHPKNPRPPLRELNQAHYPHYYPVFPPVNAVKTTGPAQKKAYFQPVVPNMPAVNSSIEPVPRHPPLQNHTEQVTLCNLRHEVEQLLHPTEQRIPYPENDPQNIFPASAIQHRKDVYNGQHYIENHNGNGVSDRLANNPTNLQNRVPIHTPHRNSNPVCKPVEPLDDDDYSKKNGIFRSLQQLLKQKDNKMQELQEQVKELLDLQKNQIAKSEPFLSTQMDKENSNLMNKIDKQNEELMKLKDQISLLLENQAKEMSLTKTSQPVFVEMEKCSVGVMTSMLADPKELNAAICFSEAVRLNQRLHGQTCMQPPDTLLTGDSTIGKSDCGTRAKRTERHHLTVQENARGENRCLKNCCGCRCTSPDLSIEEFRIEPVNDTAVYSEKSMHLDLDQLQLPIGLSVDESLPLGASVSLLEGRLRKACHSGDSNSGRSSSGSEQDVSMPRQGRRVRRMDGRSRFSLPRQHWDHREDDEKELAGQRRLTLPSEHHFLPRSDSPTHHWEGSILLPRLNYQTLHFSDDSDSESGHIADNLSEKYLDHRKGRSSPPHETARRDPKKQITQIQKSECAELYSKNMSFATKEYLEKYGLVS